MHFGCYGDSGFGAQRPELRWAFSQGLVRVSAGFAHRAVAARKGTRDGDMQNGTGLATVAFMHQFLSALLQEGSELLKRPTK